MQIRKSKGRIDREKISALTDADRERLKREDGIFDADYGPPRVVLPRTDVRALRERLGLTQEGFAERFFLPLRTIQDWEQERRDPSETARVLLYAIANDAGGVERALHLRSVHVTPRVTIDGRTRVGDLRKVYGPEFLPTFRSDASLHTVLKKSGTQSLLMLCQQPARPQAMQLNAVAGEGRSARRSRATKSS